MASTGEGEGWQVRASPVGPAGKGPGWEDERVRVGQDKGPAPHLAARRAGHHLHDKEKPLSIWAGPKGDLPTAFEVGSREGRGLGSPRRFPQVRSSAGTGPWGQHDYSVPRPEIITGTRAAFPAEPGTHQPCTCSTHSHPPRGTVPNTLSAHAQCPSHSPRTTPTSHSTLHTHSEHVTSPGHTW